MVDTFFQAVMVTPQFDHLDIFWKYADQEFSIADCASFVVARDRRIREVFGFDTNFLTMGFVLKPGQST